MADPRAVLGVDRYATIGECRKAYRKLAKAHHPDVDQSPGATKRMAEITAAWALVQKLPQPRPTVDPSARRGRGAPPRPYAGMSDEDLGQAAARSWGERTFRSAFFGQDFWEGPWDRQTYTEGTSPDLTGADLKRHAEAFARHQAERAGDPHWSDGLPTWPDGSLKVTAADFTGDPCDFRMPGGLFEGNKLGDILRDHEWYGDEIDQYPIGDPIRGLFKTAKHHLEREKKGRPIHEW